MRIKALGGLCVVIGRLRLAGWDFLTSFGELQGVGSPSPSSFELEPEHEPEPPNSWYSKLRNVLLIYGNFFITLKQINNFDSN